LEGSLEQVSGKATALDRTKTVKDDHAYHIILFRQTSSLNINLFRMQDFTVSAGGSFSLRALISNTSTYRENGRAPQDDTEYHAHNDLFDFSPGGNVLFEYKNLGIRYMIIGLSIYQKAIELNHFDHRLSLNFKLKSK
jgi:hypothetical protein